MGRYLATDSLGLEAGLNLYAYVENDPANLVDPEGQFLTSVDAACARNPSLCAALTGGAGGAAFSAGIQYARHGCVDPWEVGRDALIGAALGAGFGRFAPMLGKWWGAGSASRAAVPTANRLAHIFDKAEHALGDFAAASGGRERAFAAVQRAANEALNAGKLAVGPNGVIPTGNAGPIINVAGTQIRLIGGRVIDGAVRLSSFSRKGLP